MKTIKTYEGFFKKFFNISRGVEKKPTETTKEIYKKNKLIFEDCFLDLKDIGLSVHISQVYDQPIKIYISNISQSETHFSQKIFNGGDIIETLLFAVSYLTSELTLKIDKIEITRTINGPHTKTYTSLTKKLINEIKYMDRMTRFCLYLYSPFEDTTKYNDDSEPF